MIYSIIIDQSLTEGDRRPYYPLLRTAPKPNREPQASKIKQMNQLEEA